MNYSISPVERKKSGEILFTNKKVLLFYSNPLIVSSVHDLGQFW